MFDSSSYNLSHPMFSEDIGLANGYTPLNFPYTGLYGSCYMGGFTGARDSMILKGPLSHDVVELPQKEKDKRTWKNILTLAALGTVCVVGFKLGKKVITKSIEVIKNIFKKKS